MWFFGLFLFCVCMFGLVGWWVFLCLFGVLVWVGFLLWKDTSHTVVLVVTVACVPSGPFCIFCPQPGLIRICLFNMLDSFIDFCLAVANTYRNTDRNCLYLC